MMMMMRMMKGIQYEFYPRYKAFSFAELFASQSAPPATPVSSGRKRAASVSPDGFSVSHKKRGRASGPAAVMDVADAIRGMASSLTSGDGTKTSPQRRTSAVQEIARNKNFTLQERVQALKLFRGDIAIADTYLAVEGDEELRDLYLRSEFSES